MALPLYLAMTDGEMAQAETLPEKLAWMACHFSPYGTGLSNLPPALSEGSFLILNDRTPVCGHDPQRIADQLLQLTAQNALGGILLDFQRPGQPQTAKIADAVIQALPCPVGVSEAYAAPLSCPVFLDPIAPHKSLKEQIEKWTGRPIWLDAALYCETVTVTAEGSLFAEAPLPEEETGFQDESLCCRYRIRQEQEQVIFTLWRDRSCLDALLTQAAQLGAEMAFGLYQQLGKKHPAE